MANDSNHIPRCGDCRYYDALKTICRRDPPKAFPMPGNVPGVFTALCVWPPVDAARDWCGQYQQDPNAPRGDA